MTKDIVINHAPHETRVAVLENGTLSALHYERGQEQRTVGNIYKGKVLKVLPGMDSAFVEIGAERAAFFYIGDLIDEGELLDKNPRSKHRERESITSMLKEKQDVLVQVSKGPIGTKGSRITSHISLPGRNLVYMPASRTLGVSRQILEDSERTRLKEIVERLRPAVGDVLVAASPSKS